MRFVDDKFQENYLPTIGVDFKFKMFDIQNKKLKLQIWDTAGQEKFRSMCNIYYKGADFIILIFDLSNEQSLLSIGIEWLEEIAIYCESSKIQLILLGSSKKKQKRFAAKYFSLKSGRSFESK